MPTIKVEKPLSLNFIKKTRMPLIAWMKLGVTFSSEKKKIPCAMLEFDSTIYGVIIMS